MSRTRPDLTTAHVLQDLQAVLASGYGEVRVVIQHYGIATIYASFTRREANDYKKKVDTDVISSVP